ncbi:AAA family ATPase [Paenibacillus sp. SZ31]|uniref:LuxR C-terminal-related transcriptional regulator n=1 Tax=Paenibacillus sp. SZ31 TaxID=2725555 RepID=UPI00146F86E9|nr:LuxR C-terminal-related transcriptional regulator [Paenibacillus sp. SZ31]NMI07899.1 AAA family ATPase [Paenibacillus sp. SZ31]
MKDISLQNYKLKQGMQLTPFLEFAVMLADMLNSEHQEIPFLGSLHPGAIHVQEGQQKASWIYTITDENMYHSPEQFGHINIVPDHRSDLYALGVILYELFTGQLPYYVQDAEDWEMVHLSYTPIPITQLKTDCPPVIEAILLKLLNKNVDQRYQSAHALLHDLKILQSMDLSKLDESFHMQLGAVDLRKALSGLDIAHSRTSELNRLEDALSQVDSEAGAMVIVTGAAGSGKTSLIQQFLKRVHHRINIITDDLTPPSVPKVPFQAVIRMLQQCFVQLWGESSDTIEQMRVYIEQHLPNRTEIDVLSKELNLLFKRQPLTTAGNSNTPQPESVFLVLQQGFATVLGPMIVFFDHLEQADTETIQFLNLIRRQPEQMKGMLVITAISNHEVWVPDRGNSMTHILPISLLPLHYKDVYLYLSSLLKENSSRIHWLARILFEQTKGNLLQMSLQIRSWLELQQIKFDDHKDCWTWSDELLLFNKPLDVDQEAFQSEFSLLAEPMQQLLMYAASIGVSFEKNMIPPLIIEAKYHLEQLLHEAESEGYIARTPYDLDEADERYHFIHGPLRQLIYETKPEQRAFRHLKLALWLEQQFKPETSRFYENVIEHWNLAAACLSTNQKVRLAQNNYHASQYWHNLKNYKRSGFYAEKVIEFIESTDPSPVHSLLFNVKMTHAYSLYMCNETALAEALLNELLKEQATLTVSERTRVYSFLMEIYAFVDNHKVLEYGNQALGNYQWSVSLKPSGWRTAYEVIRTKRALHKRGEATLVSICHEPDYLELCLIISQLSLPLLIENGQSLFHLQARFIRYGLSRGYNQSFIEITVNYRLLLEKTLPHTSHLLGAAKLEKLYDLIADTPYMKHRSDYWKGIICHSDQPAQTAEYLALSLRRSIELGDINFSNFVWISLIITNTNNLNTLNEQLLYFKKHLLSMSSKVSRDIYSITTEYLTALKQTTPDISHMTKALLVQERADQLEYDNYECMCKLELAYVFEEYDLALTWAARARHSEFSYDWVRIRKQRMYELLVLLSLYEQGKQPEKKIRQTLQLRLRHIRKWRGIYGFDSAVHEWLRAEWSKLKRRHAEAVLHYQEAARKAKAEKQDWLAGIMYERMALLCEEDPRQQLLIVMDACTAYSEWGMDFKIPQLQNKYAGLLRQAQQRWNHTLGVGIWASSIPIASAPSLEQNNLAMQGSSAALTQSSAYEGHLQVEQMMLDFPASGNGLQELLELAIRQTGADNGQIILWHETKPQRVASPSWSTVPKNYPEKVLRYVTNTQEVFILPDAVQSHFSTDQYHQTHLPHSVLCMPIAFPGFGENLMLYLENSYLANVFTARDVSIVELLISRAAYLQMLQRDNKTGIHTFVTESVPIPIPHEDLAEPLTERELEILDALSEGMSNKNIAERLGIKENTVKTHISNIFGKLEVKRRGQAVARAKQLNLIQ